jgi:hypothetical protein
VLAWTSVAIAALLIRLFLLPVWPIPQPRIHDEFSYLLAADTFSAPKLQAKGLETTRRKPKDGSTHWSCRKLADQLGISKDTVQRIWRKAGLKPHRLERCMASDDPEFERKAADILDPVLPMAPARAEHHAFKYYRHGTLSLYAALDVRSGKVHGKTAARHTSDQFVDFSPSGGRLVQAQAADPRHPRQLSAHRTEKLASFLQEHLNVELHSTLTYSSWLNQVEIWFSRIERHVIARGVFTSAGISPASSSATFVPTRKLHGPSIGSIPMYAARHYMLTSPRQATGLCA